MNKKDLMNEMRTATGASFITRKQVSTLLNLRDPGSVDKFLYGLPRISGRYFIGDVAERLIDQLEFRR